MSSIYVSCVYKFLVHLGETYNTKTNISATKRPAMKRAVSVPFQNWRKSKARKDWFQRKKKRKSPHVVLGKSWRDESINSLIRVGYTLW